MSQLATVPLRPQNVPPTRVQTMPRRTRARSPRAAGAASAPAATGPAVAPTASAEAFPRTAAGAGTCGSISASWSCMFLLLFIRRPARVTPVASRYAAHVQTRAKEHHAEERLHFCRPRAGRGHRARGLHRRARRGRARDRRAGLRHAPRRHGRAPAVARERRREQVLLHRVQDPARRRHGRFPHPRALGAVRKRRVPGQGALRQPAQDEHADVPERPYLPRQDHVPGGVHQHRRPGEPHGGLPRRGAPPGDLSPSAHL